MDFNNKFSTLSNWFTDPISNKLGLLQIYVNDMLFPVLSVPMNLPKMLNLDTHQSVDPLSEETTPDYLMAGKAYLSLAATTTDNNFGVLQVLRWTFEEVAMCPILKATCTISGLSKGQAFRSIIFKNIGKEKIYIKFKY